MPRFASPEPATTLGEVDPRWLGPEPASQILGESPDQGSTLGPSPALSNGSPLPPENRLEDGRRSVGASDPDQRTATSSGGKWRPGGDPGHTAKVLTGLLLAAGLIVARVARWRGWEIRTPNGAEAEDIMTPIAAIAVRRLPMDVIGPDLGDFGTAVAATDSYLRAGPLAARIVPDAGRGIPSHEEI